MYQGGSDAFLGPRDPVRLADPAWGIDFEAEVAVVVGDVPKGASREQAAAAIKLLMLVNDVSLRNLIPAELAKGFGFLQGKGQTAFSPVAVTPDELGAAWDGGKVELPLLSHLNDAPFGRPNAGADMTFDFPALIVHAVKTRAARRRHDHRLRHGVEPRCRWRAGPADGRGRRGLFVHRRDPLGRDHRARRSRERRFLTSATGCASRCGMRPGPLDLRRDRAGGGSVRPLRGGATPMNAKGFASTTDTGEKKISFEEIGPGLYAFTAEGDPNSGVIVGDDSVMVVDAQATPVMALEVIERVRKVTEQADPLRAALALPCGPRARRLGLCGRRDPRLRRHARTDRRARQAGQGFRDRPLSAAVPGGGEHSRPHLADHHLSASRCRSGSAGARCGSCIWGARIPRATWSPPCRTPAWCSPATSSNTTRPAIAATRISPTGRRRSTASPSSGRRRWCPAAVRPWPMPTRSMTAST